MLVDDSKQISTPLLGNRLPGILLVDDEEEMLREYQDFLELKGFASLICSDPLQAVQMVLDQPSIRLVITDLWMKNLDGASLINQLRATLPPQRRVKFAILTGDMHTAIPGGAEDIQVLFKPIDTHLLISLGNSAQNNS